MNDRDYSAGIGDVKRLSVLRSSRTVERRLKKENVRLQWTLRTAIAAVIGSVLFICAFLYVLLTYLSLGDLVRH